MKIKIKQIIRWEQITDKAFCEFDPNEENDVVALMYVTSSDAAVKEHSFEIYSMAVKAQPKLIENDIKKITQYLNYINQFSHYGEDDTQEVDPMALHKDEEKEPESIRTSDIVNSLIFEGGIDANYLLNDAEICDLPMLCKGLEIKMRHAKEDSRLWTYLMCSPYLSESCKNATYFYPFPWEEEGKPEIIAEGDLAMAEAILNEGKEANNG
ncbi:MAG: hypothetical protein WCS15_11665 [Prevotella sp.]